MKRVWSSIFIAALAAVLFWGSFLLREYAKTLGWLQAKGQVASSLLDIRYLPRHMYGQQDLVRWYGADVLYEYSVGDRTYLSHQVSLGEGQFRDLRKALETMNRYRRQRNVIVYYDPQDPRRAVLEPWSSVPSSFMFFMAVGMLAAFGLSIHRPAPSEDLVSRSAGHIRKGYICQNQGKLNEAIAEYNQAIVVDPLVPRGYTYRGVIYFQKGNWNQAISDFDQALRIDPKDALAQVGRKNAYLEKQYDRKPG